MKAPARVLAVLIGALALSTLGAAPAAAPSRLAITLTDGSLLIGECPLQTLAFLPDGMAKVDIPVKSIDALSVSADDPLVTVNFVNGDHLHGRIDPSVSFQLRTMVGPVTVPLSAVGDIRFFPADKSSGIDWVNLPFPDDAWNQGDRGQPMQARQAAMILRGQPVGTRGLFQAPRSFEFDVSLDKMTASDGCLWVVLIPADGHAEVSIPPRNVAIQFGYHSQGKGTGMFTISRGGDAKDLGKGPFDFDAGKPSHLKLEVSATSIRATLNGESYEDDAALPFTKFRVELIGWQPSNTWTVENITIR